MSDSQGKAAPVRQLNLTEPKVNQDVVDILRRCLVYAEAGELIGFVIFAKHTGNEIAEAQAGDTDFRDILVAFEDWKFKRVYRRNMEE
jgi:hypothetical protein